MYEEEYHLTAPKPLRCAGVSAAVGENSRGRRAGSSFQVEPPEMAVVLTKFIDISIHESFSG